MKKIFTLAMIMTIAISVYPAMPLGSTKKAMSYTEAKNEALFLSDKMAYELNLTNAQYGDVYEINLDYLMSVNGRNDLYGRWWDKRNTDLQFVLTAYQYNKYLGLSYFYRPLSWNSGHVTLNIYSHYTDRKRFYKGRPTVFASYKGGNNKKSNHYADRKPKHSDNAVGSTWRNTGNNSGSGSTWRNTGGNNGGGSTWRNTGSNGNTKSSGNTKSNGNSKSNGNTHSNGNFGGSRQTASAHGSFAGK